MRIAILAPGAAAAFQAEARLGIGGAERQLATLARGLAGRGHEVDVILAAANGDQEPAQDREGCLLWPIYPLDGPPLLKLVHPKGSALFRFLRQRRPGLLLQRGAAELTGIGRAVTRMLSMGFVFAVASDSDLVPGSELLPHPQDRALYRQGLRGADLHVVQTRGQQLALRRSIGREGTLLRSFLDGELPAVPILPQGEAILWGGNLRPVKRPEWMLALAAAFPECRFIVFGGAARGYERYAQGIIAAFAERSNIDYRGPLPGAALPALYAQCRVLLNTSVTEGFPNTFLEAWRQGLDLVASVDPDGLLGREGLGLVARGFPGLKARLRESLTAPAPVLAERRARAHGYLLRAHDSAELVSAWERILSNCNGL